VYVRAGIGYPQAFAGVKKRGFALQKEWDPVDFLWMPVNHHLGGWAHVAS